MRFQRLRLPDGETSWTVLGDDWLPVAPVEEFLEYLRAQRRSPNTVRSYAHGLARWWQYLGLDGVGWEDVSVERLAGFLVWLRSGETSSVVSIVEPPAWLSEATAHALKRPWLRSTRRQLVRERQLRRAHPRRLRRLRPRPPAAAPVLA